jgi:hypothetical protein
MHIGRQRERGRVCTSAGRERGGERHLHSDDDLALLGHWLCVLCARAVGCSVLGGQCAIFISGRDVCTGLVTDTALVAGLVTDTALDAGLVTDTALVAGLVTDAALIAGLVTETALDACLVTDATLVFDELVDGSHKRNGLLEGGGTWTLVCVVV